jgi:hypothetical protein
LIREQEKYLDKRKLSDNPWVIFMKEKGKNNYNKTCQHDNLERSHKGDHN